MSRCKGTFQLLCPNLLADADGIQGPLKPLRGSVTAKELVCAPPRRLRGELLLQSLPTGPGAGLRAVLEDMSSTGSEEQIKSRSSPESRVPLRCDMGARAAMSPS